ncbi:MAG: cyclic 2,3-diphosphoglycerate synthase [marine benthic group bacterium]|jgi:predicted GTPase|nr:cyclic 2,3-diphosphoglycerate synthase [Gemmatimonadota bacterium]MCL7974959.1 cyclic 2,3-diphosphoglycerate synthase [Gemmatimonadota bacterium]MCL7978260.1 cyclic 2,3-diphosphoglycerate synthase [Gemmatimonadota bacterium]MCL7981939.1 cyclic 2,3-diphosphoglycerate synthase [Gemmatimonadota bacterium]
MTQRVLILGAAGRDFHNFNTFFRGNRDYEVVAFTATQIPDIEGRRYPAVLAGEGYPNGIPIHAENEMEALIAEHGVDVVVFAYSDVTHQHVMHLGSRAMAAGASYMLLGARQTMVESTKPVVAVCAARTGSGKSQTSRRVAELLTAAGKKVVVIRHPMPYGDLAKQAVQRFETYDDLATHEVTIEEREEYEPHIDADRIVYAGVDYEAILREAEKEADVVIWDGGNNDLPFYVPDVLITVVDPHRPDHAIRYHPGETNVRMADAILINKVDTASLEGVELARRIAAELNPGALVIEGASPLFVEDGESIRGKRALVVEDGPTLTHGEMAYGAGWVAARRYGASEIVDPRPFAVGSIADTYARYPTTGDVLPAMGYGEKQVAELEETIRAADVDVVVIGTPIDLTRLIDFDKPSVRVRYELQEIGSPTLAEALKQVL